MKADADLSLGFSLNEKFAFLLGPARGPPDGAPQLVTGTYVTNVSAIVYSFKEECSDVRNHPSNLLCWSKYL